MFDESSPSASPSGSGLGPSGVSGALIDQLSAFGTITAYSIGLVNTEVMQLASGQGAWYPAFSAGLATAKQHAQEWLGVIGPDGFAAIPNAIITFGTTFNNVASDISGILGAALASSSGVLSSGQATEIKELIGALLPTIESVLGSSTQSAPTTILGLSGLLSGFIVDVEHDYSALVQGQQGASAELTLDETTLSQLKGDIAALEKSIKKFNQDLEIEVGAGATAFAAFAVGAALAGPSTLGLGALVMLFVGFVAEAASVTAYALTSSGLDAAEQQLKTDQSGLTADDVQITSLQAITNSIDTLTSGNQKAQSSIETVLNMFSTLKGRVENVISGLSGVDASGLAPIIQDLNLQDAQTAWGQLVTYAQTIQSTSMSTTIMIPNSSGTTSGAFAG
jgi:hypothetical protein